MLREFSALVFVSLWVSVGAAAGPRYSIVDLTPADFTNSVAYDINSDGDVVGVAGRFVGGSLEEAFFHYDHSTGVSTVIGLGTVLPRTLLTGPGAREAAINDSGRIVGTARFSSGAPERRAFIYDSDTFTNLGTFFQGIGTGSNVRPASDAVDVNSSGVATGFATSGVTGSDTADIYTSSGAPISDIDGDLSAASNSDRANAINDAGLIAGRNQSSKATLFSGATETEFLAGTSLASESSTAMDLNEVGQVTGHTTSTSESFVFDTSTSSLTRIPQMGTGNRMFAKAINESGDVVGWGDKSTSLDGMGQGFVYTDGATYNLFDQTIFTGSDTPGLSDWGRLLTAWGINDSGSIVGVGERRFDANSFPNQRAYLLTVVPEPSSICVLWFVTISLTLRRSRWDTAR